MKKIKMLLIIMMLLLVSVSVACKKDDVNEDNGNTTVEKVKVLLPSGTPLIALGGLLDNSNFEFEVSNGQELLSAGLLSNDYDLIVAPLNLGYKLFTKNQSQYKLDSIITTNNTYLYSLNELSLASLNGKTVLAYGQGSSPYVALNKFNAKNQLGLTIETLTSASDVQQTFMANNTYDAYLGAEPNISIIKSKGKQINVMPVTDYIDIDVLIQACLFVNKNKNVKAEVLETIKNNINSMNNNPTEYVNSIFNKENVTTKYSFFNTVGKETLTSAIPNCNIVYLKGSENKDTVNTYLTFVGLLSEGTVSNEFYF